MVQAQVTSYQIENNKIPTKEELLDANYLRSNPVCPNGNVLVISADGEVTEGEETADS